MTKPSWREVLVIHPAAEMLPLMTPDELKGAVKDIKKNSVQMPIIVQHERDADGGWSYALLDGRNRLDAVELAGFDPISARGRSRGAAHRRRNGYDCGLDLRLGVPDGEIAIQFIPPPNDPYAFVLSANIHRRHLTAEQKRKLITKLLKARPERSNREIARQVKASHHTVEAVRTKMESTGQIAQLEKTVGADNKARTTKPRRREVDSDINETALIEKKSETAAPKPEPGPAIDPLVIAWDRASAGSREALVVERKLEVMHAQQKVGRSAHRSDVAAAVERAIPRSEAQRDSSSDALDPSDPGPIPECLRRSAP